MNVSYDLSPRPEDRGYADALNKWSFGTLPRANPEVDSMNYYLYTSFCNNVILLMQEIIMRNILVMPFITVMLCCASFAHAAMEGDTTVAPNYIKHEGNKVWISGLEKACWGGMSEQQNSVIGALAPALQLMGEKVDYNYLMGVGGAAFRLQLSWGPDAPHAECGRNCAIPALAAVGYSVTKIKMKGKEAPTTDAITEARIAIVASINAGRPVLYGGNECSLIVGYLDEGKTLFMRAYSAEFSDTKEGYVEMKDWPWDFGILSEKTTPPARRESIIKSLQSAIEMANTPKYDNYFSGFKAYEQWQADLRDDKAMDEKIAKNFWGYCLGNGYTYGCLSDARRAGWKYLRVVSKEFTGLPAQHLQNAADIYEQLDKTLWIKRENLTCPWCLFPWDLKKASAWTPVMRHTQADVLGQIAEIEKRGLKEIQLALDTMK